MTDATDNADAPTTEVIEAPKIFAAPSTARTLLAVAVKAGVFNSPHTGEIIVVDPDHDDERHHSPLLSEREAAYAFERGLIEDPANAKHVDTTSPSDVVIDPNAIGARAAAQTEQFAAAGEAGGVGSGTLDSRGSTAWADRDRVEGGAQGFTDGIRERPADAIDQVSGDADAPPAPKATRRKTS